DNYTLYIIDISGKIVRILKDIQSDEIILYREDLKSGYYHIELFGNKTYRAKLIVK
ncbi:MAG: T9SS type A sorting domain-containing protein, partial [Bacteroidales bacterium]|nr:T9SS type A sorting domain-containing protein [Bacteroidales bacterium]